MNTLVVAHDIVSEQKSDSRSKLPLWLWSRQHAYNVIKKLMKDAGIAPGKHRPPKGLRHAYGVNAKTKDIPLNILQKWMGHADITTTALYANAIRKEEAKTASKMWS